MIQQELPRSPPSVAMENLTTGMKYRIKYILQLHDDANEDEKRLVQLQRCEGILHMYIYTT